jgi:hypothetical protein
MLRKGAPVETDSYGCIVHGDRRFWFKGPTSSPPSPHCARVLVQIWQEIDRETIELLEQREVYSKWKFISEPDDLCTCSLKWAIELTAPVPT